MCAGRNAPVRFASTEATNTPAVKAACFGATGGTEASYFELAHIGEGRGEIGIAITHEHLVAGGIAAMWRSGSLGLNRH